MAGTGGQRLDRNLMCRDGGRMLLPDAQRPESTGVPFRPVCFEEGCRS